MIYPRFDDYISQISFRIGYPIDDAISVKLQLSNGYCYYPGSTGDINKYSLRPRKLQCIKISNGKLLNMFHVFRLNDQKETILDSCYLTHWQPLNKIDNRQFHDAIATFDISGDDSYLIC